MENYLKNIKFPVYPLPKHIVPHKEGGIISVLNSNKIIDDKNISGDSLGTRRLQIDKKLLYPLSRAILNISNFLLYTKIYSLFIDSSGKLFKYEKRANVPLIYKKIINKIPYSSGTILIIEGIHCPIWYYRAIDTNKLYAALLCIEKGYILLGVTSAPSKRTKFKV